MQFAIALLATAPAPQPAVQALPKLPPEIRVVLSDGGDTQSVGGELAWSSPELPLGKTSGAVTVRVTETGVKATLGKTEREAVRLIAQPLADKAYGVWSSHSYRGHFEFFRGKKGGLVVLNVVPLEDYLLGVVPSEMPASWPVEALRAQAVAARTFAVSRMIDHMYDTYDVYDDQSAQVYLGVRGESANASKAVRDTAGQVLTYQGAPIVAYFFSDAGGYTKDGKQAYLRAKPTRYAKSPHNSWQVPLAPEDLARYAKKCGTDVGQVRSVSCENDAVSGYLKRVFVEGAAGRCEIGANKLRELLGLDKMKSTRAWFTLPGQDSAPPSAPAPQPVNKSTPRVVVEAGESAYVLPVLEGWARPSVASAKGVRELKLRTLLAWDGYTLIRCDERVYVWGGRDAGSAPAPGTPPPAAPGSPADADSAAAVPATATLKVGPEGVVLSGTGYGHGLGMPQYGARALAEQGQSYRDILLYFYTGVELVNWDGSLARVAPVVQDEKAPEEKGTFYQPFNWNKRQ